MRIPPLTLLVASIAIALSTAVAPTATAAPGCGSPSATIIGATQIPFLAWSENLAYDPRGRLWVSRLYQGEVEQLSTTRTRRTSAVPVEYPGAVRSGPDGQMYVASGNTPTNMLPGSTNGRILRFNPTGARPVPRAFVGGLGMPNGLAFGEDGALYVADSSLGVVRVRRNGSIDRAWTARTKAALAPLTNGFGANGITALNGNLYVTLTTSLTGRVLRIPEDNPGAASTLDLTAPLPGLLDDLVALPADMLAVTTVTGQLITVNTRTRHTCSHNLGQPLTALAVDPRHRGRLTVATESGTLIAVRLP